MDGLTDDDIDVLIDAMEAWENKDLAGEMMGDLFSMVLTEKTPEAKAKLEADRGLDREKRARERQIRKNRSIVLRAKLIGIRNERAVDSVAVGAATLRGSAE